MKAEEFKTEMGLEAGLVVFQDENKIGIFDKGKYRSGITFVISKGYDEEILETPDSFFGIVLGDNSGKALRVRGDFWTSKKGSPCFAPKSTGRYWLVYSRWGGAFAKGYGIEVPEDAPFYRRARSNGGGAGNDFLILPVGWKKEIKNPFKRRPSTTPGESQWEEITGIIKPFGQDPKWFEDDSHYILNDIGKYGSNLWFYIPKETGMYELKTRWELTPGEYIGGTEDQKYILGRYTDGCFELCSDDETTHILVVEYCHRTAEHNSLAEGDHIYKEKRSSNGGGVGTRYLVYSIEQIREKDKLTRVASEYKEKILAILEKKHFQVAYRDYFLFSNGISGYPKFLMPYSAEAEQAYSLDSDSAYRMLRDKYPAVR